jgi:hypothetical protein
VAEREREVAAQSNELEARQRVLDAKAAQIADIERAAAAEAERVRLETVALAERQRNLARVLEEVTATPPVDDRPAPLPAPPAAPMAELAAIGPETRLDLAERPERNIDALAQLVDRYADTYPERAEEWRMYVAYLRDFAAQDGRLPSSFDGLVAEVFGDLLDREAPDSR